MRPTRAGCGDPDRDSGASAVEYALMVSAIAALIVVIVVALGKVVEESFQKTCDNVRNKVTTSETCN